MSKIKNVTIGADPELFLVNPYDGNKIVPAYYFISGNKELPTPITDEGHYIQHDNVMVEYCIPPCKNVKEFIDNNKFVLSYINETIAEPNGLLLNIVASGFISSEIAREEIAETFGCSPDFNVYDLSVNEVNRDNPLRRTCGGHIHIGYDNPNSELSIKLIKALDLFVSIPLVLLEPDSDRKLMYGKAGCFRFKDYGFEYRSTSNWWLTSDFIMKWLYESIQHAIDFVNSNGIITNEEDIIRAINENNKDLATEILDDYNITIPELITV